MTLLPNWRAVLARAWSIRWMAAALVFSALEAAMPYLEPSAGNGLFALLAAAATAGGFAARLMAQAGLSGGGADGRE